MKISIASSVYVNYAIEDAAIHISKAGCDGIDIWGGRPHVYRQDLGPKRLNSLRSLLENEGLSVPSFMPAFFRYPHSLSNPNEIIRQDSLEYMYICIDNAVTLGAKSVLIVPGRCLHGQEPEDAWQRLIESVQAVCEYAKPFAIRLSIEPVNYYVSDLVNTASDAVRIIQQVAYEHLGVTLDTGHVHLSDETFTEALAKCEDRLHQIHVNDNDGKKQQNLVLGKGTFDFKAFVATLEKHQYSGFLTSELGWEYTLDPDPAVALAVQRMREIFQ
jgi:protein FrlC